MKNRFKGMSGKISGGKKMKLMMGKNGIVIAGI